MSEKIWREELQSDFILFIALFYLLARKMFDIFVFWGYKECFCEHKVCFDDESFMLDFTDILYIDDAAIFYDCKGIL